MVKIAKETEFYVEGGSLSVEVFCFNLKFLLDFASNKTRTPALYKKK